MVVSRLNISLDFSQKQLCPQTPLSIWLTKQGLMAPRGLVLCVSDECIIEKGLLYHQCQFPA